MENAIGIKNNIFCEIGIDTNKTFSIAANNVMFCLFGCCSIVLNLVGMLFWMLWLN